MNKRDKQKAMTDKQKKHIAKIIGRQLGWTNGWYVSDEAFERECKSASTKIVRYLKSAGLAVK